MRSFHKRPLYTVPYADPQARLSCRCAFMALWRIWHNRAYCIMERCCAPKPGICYEHEITVQSTVHVLLAFSCVFSSVFYTTYVEKFKG